MALLTQTFNGAHTFYIDSQIANGARTVDISKINLYFKFKPDIALNPNEISDAGISMFIADTLYGVPRVTRESGIFRNQIARVPLRNVATSTDATLPTEFRFRRPITIETDKEYSFIFTYELFADYVAWTSVQGEILTGTTTVSPGASDQLIGRYFDFNGVFVAETDNDLDEYIKNWRPLSDTTLKFDVFIARYAHGGVPVSANGSIDSSNIILGRGPNANVVANSSGINFNVNFGSFEFVTFNENKSAKSLFVGGQDVFANTVYYPGGIENSRQYLELTVAQGNNVVTANSTYPNGAAFAWTDIFPAPSSLNKIVITDGTKHNVRTIDNIISNTVMSVNEDITFSNTTAKMMITPVGTVSSFNKDSPFGIEESFLMIANSSANSTVRFVNNVIEAVSVTAGGTGYSNDDIFYVKGFESVANKVEGGYLAVGNVVTNSTGGIDTIYLANLGCGFVNTSTIEAVVANSTSGNTSANTSAGSSATFSYTIGSTIKTPYGNNTFKECVVRNLDIGEFIPYSRIEVPPGTNYTLRLESTYYKVEDTSTYFGEAIYVNPTSADDRLQITMYSLNRTEGLAKTPVIPSKSNEFNIKYADTSDNDKISNTGSPSSESLKIVSDISSNSDFSTVRVTRPSVQFSKYVINNDATNEHTDTGNAYAKGLTNVIDFGRTAEDVRVYLTAYKPANTDLKVYARIYKNEDPEAFDDKNWTELELKEGVGLLSSSSDTLDYVELGYGFYQKPKDRLELDGVATLTSACNEVNGVGTDFSTDLSAGDLVFMYQPLFPNNHIVASVESVTNTTQIVIDTTTSNASILAEGMKIDKCTYPNQAFNNKQNDNIVRYYNSTMSHFDGYETIAIKIVFLSSSPNKIPRVDDIRFVGTSA
jgi:hypothetical protein